MASRQEGDLLLDLSDVIVAAFEIDVLDGHGLACSLVEGTVDDAEGAACEDRDVLGIRRCVNRCDVRVMNVLPSSSSM
ncbi:hypothetical protein BBD39_09165 [Arsenophonus endosymbiont of Bemisia tabaci Asia II 3]|nr:hypothetical protein BBD39_09165 [Arsenophonus endosymbiont of Bemisia tabaci Asia II 3]